MGGWVFKNVEIFNYYHYLVGGCHKKVKLSITFLYKSLMFTVFLQKRNFSTSQSRKKELPLFLKPKACWFWTIVKQKNVSFFCRTALLPWQTEKKTSDLVCLFFASFILETWKNKQLWKRQNKKALFFFQRQVFSVLFLATGKLCFKQNEQNFAI